MFNKLINVANFPNTGTLMHLSWVRLGERVGIYPFSNSPFMGQEDPGVYFVLRILPRAIWSHAV